MSLSKVSWSEKPNFNRSGVNHFRYMYVSLRILKNDFGYNLKRLVNWVIFNSYHAHTYLTGNGKIIHLTPNRSGCDGLLGIFTRFLSKSIVKCDNLEDVAELCDVSVNNFLDDKLKWEA